MICNSWNGGEFFDDSGLYLIVMFYHGNLNFLESAVIDQGDRLERCGRVRRLGLRDYQKGLRHAGKQHSR